MANDVDGMIWKLSRRCYSKLSSHARRMWEVDDLFQEGKLLETLCRKDLPNRYSTRERLAQ